MPDRIADLMAWGLSEGVARRVASRDRPVGPVRDQRSEAARLEALLATRDRLAQQTPTDQLIASIDPRLAGPRIGAAPAPQPPTVTLASIGPDAGAHVVMPDPKRGQPPLRLTVPPTMRGGDAETMRTLLAQPAQDTPGSAPSTFRDNPLGWALEHGMDLGRGFIAGDGSGTTAEGLGALLSAGLPILGAGGTSLKRILTGGFYSRVDEAAKFLPSKGVKAESLINTLKKASGGVSAEELELRGLAEFAASKRGQVVTPADLAAHLKANPAPFPTVKTLGVEAPEETLTLADRKRLVRLEAKNAKAPLGAIDDQLGEGTYVEMIRLQNIRDASSSDELMAKSDALTAQAQRLIGTDPIKADRLFTEANHYTARNEELVLHDAGIANPTKFSKYQVPGGENYRETLLTLPKASEQFKVVKHPSIKDKWVIQHPDGSFQMNGAEPAYWSHKSVAESIASGDGYATRGNFKSSHFDEPNILAHTRANERTLPTGERGTFLEEVQSDWHQRGKEQGYRGEELSLTPEERAKKFINGNGGNWDLLTTEQQQRNIELAQSNPNNPDWAASFGRADAVPDAPFKENWPDLGLKQALIDEANRAPDSPGFLGVTGGKTQADRYDLSKQLSSVSYNAPDGWRGKKFGAVLKAFDKNGNEIINQSVTPERLSDYIGKEAAQKLIDSEPIDGLHKLTGLDLQVGGEGMHEFYDKLLPKRLEKIVKPFGGSVEPGALSAPVGRPTQYADSDAWRSAKAVGPTQEPMWFAKLTPEMKARILKEGLPLMGLSGVTLGSLLGAEKQQAR